jgi:hypothetical protein
LLVARRGFLSARLELASLARNSILGEVARAVAAPRAAEEEAFLELKRRVGNPGSRAVFREALRWVDFTRDPMPAAVSTFAADACALGLIPSVACDSLFTYAS